jgi:ATP-dependent Clp protease adapter protein ClpS
MTDTITKPKIQDEIKVERPRLHKVILLNDDFTPREFVVTVLNAKFRMSEDQARRVMMLIGAARVSSPSTQKMWQKPKQPMRRTPAEAKAIHCCSRPSRRNRQARGRV